MNGAGFMRRAQQRYLFAYKRYPPVPPCQTGPEPCGGRPRPRISEYKMQPGRIAMSRKSMISFFAIAVLAAATLGSGAAQAGGGGPHAHAHMHGHAHWKHWHYVHFHDRVYVRPVAYAVRTSSPGPCTCLTKNYTPDGKVIFADLCTKEMASAPVDGIADHAEVTDRPTNMAGQTYQDFLKANPQAAPTQKN